MHDWIFVSLLFDWKNACVTLIFRDCKSETVFLTAENVVNLVAPKRNEWGRSENVNAVSELVQQENGIKLLRIEMQSGDVIEIAARTFLLPYLP